MAKPRDPYELTLSDDQTKALALWLHDELQAGIDAKGSQDQEVDYWWQLYEQARTRAATTWPNAADLTSYLASEKVDALHARMMRVIFGAEPIWTVEGWGDAADRAPFVEEFTQWKAEESRLQQAMDRLILTALVEPRGLLEIYEGTEKRLTRKEVTAKVETDPVTGGPIYNEDMELKAVMGEDGKYVPAGEQDMGVRLSVDEYDLVRVGPVERVIPYRDSVILPGHARDRDDIWGYGKRIFKRYPDLMRQAKGGLYDEDAVRAMGTNNEREQETALQRANMGIADAANPVTAEKELWELLVLVDLNAFFESRGLPQLKNPAFKKGPRWFLTTLHSQTQQLLRIQHDDLSRSRFVSMVLFPRSDRATEGYSFVGHKLITTIEEHTGVRNLRADRSALVARAPIKRLQGALWDPLDQPFAPDATIDVRDMREVEPFEIPDVSNALIDWEQSIERTAERLAGVNDIASGQVSQESRTLGEVNMATEQSFVRMDLIVRRMQEALEDIGSIRHEMWKRAAAERDGFEAPASLATNLEGRGVSIDQYMPGGKISAQLLDGAFRFKPHGSVETADPNRQMQLFVQAFQMLPTLMQAFPLQGQDPMAMSRAIWRQFCRVMRIENTQAFLGNPVQANLGAMGMMPMNGLPSPFGQTLQPPQPEGMTPPPVSPAQLMGMTPSTQTLQ